MNHHCSSCYHTYNCPIGYNRESNEYCSHYKKFIPINPPNDRECNELLLLIKEWDNESVNYINKQIRDWFTDICNKE